MNPMRRKSPFWSLAGPLLGYVGITIGVMFFLEMLVAVPCMSEAFLSLAGKETLSQDEFMNIYMEAMEASSEQILKYQILITGAAALCTLPLTVVLFKKDRRLERQSGLPVWKKSPAVNYIPVVVLGVVGSVGVTCLSAMIQMAFFDAEYQKTAESMYTASFSAQIIVLGLIVPIAEELIFRGVMFRRYRENRMFLYSALWSSLFFALMHSNGMQTMYGFLLGILLCYVYEKFGSIQAPVCLHVVLNTSSVLLTQAGVFAWLGGVPERLAVAVILCAFLCSVLFVRIHGMEDADSTRRRNGTDDPGGFSV